MNVGSRLSRSTLSSVSPRRLEPDSVRELPRLMRCRAPVGERPLGKRPPSAGAAICSCMRAPPGRTSSFVGPSKVRTSSPSPSILTVGMELSMEPMVMLTMSELRNSGTARGRAREGVNGDATSSGVGWGDIMW